MKKTVVTLAALALLILGLATTEAQEAGGEMFLSWEAHSYVPNNFEGKVLPTVGTLVTAGFDWIERGKAVDLRDQLIYWYWNNDSIGGGKGVQKISFRPSQKGTQVLSVKMPGFRGSSLTRNFEIPVVSPEAVVEVVAKGGRFSSPNLRVYGKPYFFNVADFKSLVFLWEVNGQKPGKNEEVEFLDIKLDPSTPNGTKILVDLSIQNPKTFLEAALERMALTFSK